MSVIRFSPKLSKKFLKKYYLHLISLDKKAIIRYNIIINKTNGDIEMADINENINTLEEEEVPVFTLTDEETGEEKDFVLLARGTVDDKMYFALEPADEDSDEYVILRVTEDGDDLILDSVDDDDEFDKVEDYFNDLFFSEIDYDAE